MPRPSKSPSRKELIDEFAELDRLLKLYKPQLDRHKELKAEILSWGDAESFKATDRPTFDSREFRVLLSARENKSWITDKMEVFQRLGQKTFIEIAGITLKAVREAGLEDLTETEQIGPREIVSVTALKAA